MNLAVLAAAAAVTAAPQWYIDGEFPSPEEVLAMVEQCGAGGATAEFDELLQSDVVTLPADTVLGDSQIDCLAQAAYQTGYEFYVPEDYYPEFFQRRE